MIYFSFKNLIFKWTIIEFQLLVNILPFLPEPAIALFLIFNFHF